MASNFRVAEEVEAVARPIISQYHPHLFLNDVRIVYLFCEKPKKKNGQIAWGYVQQISNLAAFLGSDGRGEDEDAPFFVMVIWEKNWRIALTEQQRAALVDHELCHLAAEQDENGKVKTGINGHDLEEFTDVVRRHGMWRDQVKHLVKAADEGPQCVFDGMDSTRVEFTMRR